MRVVKLFWRKRSPQDPDYLRRQRTGWTLFEDFRGKEAERAAVWVLGEGQGQTATWHTWDRRGMGGENATCHGPCAEYEAQACALAAVVHYESERGGAVTLARRAQP